MRAWSTGEGAFATTLPAKLFHVVVEVCKLESLGHHGGRPLQQHCQTNFLVEVFEKVCGAPKRALFTTTLAGQLFSPLYYNVAGLLGLDGPILADFLHTVKDA